MLQRRLADSIDIAAHVGGQLRVVIDMFGVKRIDFIAALLVSIGFLNHVRLTQCGK